MSISVFKILSKKNFFIRPETLLEPTSPRDIFQRFCLHFESVVRLKQNGFEIIITVAFQSEKLSRVHLERKRERDRSRAKDELLISVLQNNCSKSSNSEFQIETLDSAKFQG